MYTKLTLRCFSSRRTFGATYRVCLFTVRSQWRWWEEICNYFFSSAPPNARRSVRIRKTLLSDSRNLFLYPRPTPFSSVGTVAGSRNANGTEKRQQSYWKLIYGSNAKGGGVSSLMVQLEGEVQPFTFFCHPLPAKCRVRQSVDSMWSLHSLWWSIGKSGHISATHPHLRAIYDTF